MDDIARDLLVSLPIDDIASQVGASRDEVTQAIAAAAPALLSGMNANAQGSGDGAASLIGALVSDHSGALLDTDDPLGALDVADGAKIVDHVFGENQEQVVARLGGVGQQSLFSKLLPMIAPFVMAWLSRKLGGALQPQSEPESGGGGLGDILGGMFGGGAGGGLGDLLGGMFGSSGEGTPDLGGVLDALGGITSGSNVPDGMPDLSDLLGGGR